MASDPLDDLEMPTLRERLEPYRYLGDAELELALLGFARQFGGNGVPMPAASGADYHCPECEENVRGVSRSTGSVLACPLCGEQPGMLTLGRGPKR